MAIEAIEIGYSRLHQNASDDLQTSGLKIIKTFHMSLNKCLK